MSLYVFDIYPEHATVSADTRMSCQHNGEIYRLHDHEKKLYVIGDFIITLGGIAWIGKHIVMKFEECGASSIQQLHQITLETVSHLDELAQQIGAPLEKHKNNNYALELCAVHYEAALQHNVFYNIATYKGYKLERFDIDGTFHPYARCYGGIDTYYVQNYFRTHPHEVKQDYLKALLNGYEAAASEKIGGNLIVATQNRQNIKTSSYPIKDHRPIMNYADLVGHNIAGQNLIIECPDINGGIAQVKIDSAGMFQYNGRYYMQGDSGGKIGMDHHWGIFGGTKDLFEVTDTGYVHPSFAGPNGEILLDDEGFPKNTNFLLGIDGDQFFRGTVIAKAGKFDGDIYARNLYFWDGSDVKTLLSQATKKIPSGLLDLGNIQLDGDTGNITMTGGINMGGSIKMSGNIDLSAASKILFGENGPVKYQFSTSINGPWHDTMQTADKYRRDSLDGGIKWGAGYQFRGEDGKDGADGSDARVPEYITSTGITSTKIWSPEIIANEFSVTPGTTSNTSGGFVLYGSTGSRISEMFRIQYAGAAPAPVVTITSPTAQYVFWDTAWVQASSDFTFTGDVSFQGKVSGVTATFA